MIGVTLQNRYLIEEEIGQGGMGVVYRAHDQLLNRPVAIKMISQANIGTGGKARLLAEAQAAARLNHPNIVSVYDIGETEKQTYLVMELVQGQSLRHTVNLPLSQILDVAIQICGALEEAHRAGVVHRDLKPENIFITPKKTVKLMDFGLARRIDTPQLTEEGVLTGTLAYIAPEIIHGQPASERSDLYALGLVLYEMTTGRPAFSGHDLVSILSQHLHATVEPPSTHNPQVAPELEAMILRLLEKQPEHRPTSAGEVRQILRALRSGRPLKTDDMVGGAPIAPLNRIVRGRLVAREEELAQMLAHWKRAVNGESSVLLISGEPGIGKTRLVTELITRVELTGSLTLLGECFSHGGAPYAPIIQIIEQAVLGNSRQRPKDKYSVEKICLSSMAQADLATLAPALSARFDLPPNPPLDPLAEQQRLYAAYSSLIECLANQGPVLLVVDDAHWADRGSLDLLRHIARRASRSGWPLLLALTYREIDLTEARALNEILLDLTRERLAERIKLNRFSHEQTGLLLQSIFAEAISDEFLDSIYRETEGNPFFVEEVCKTLIEEGKILRQNGRWQLVGGGREMHIPQSVRVTIENRIARLAEPVQDILRLAGVLGRRFNYDTLQQACDHSEDELIDALEQAEKLQLLAETGSANGGSFTFTHALIPAVLVEGVSGLRRRRLHRKAIETISRLQPDDYESLAHHSVLAADDTLALDYFSKAADRARRLYANQDAVRLYGESLALLPDDDPRRFELLMQRAAVHALVAQRAGQKADIEELLRLADAQEDPKRCCQAFLAQADFYLDTDHTRSREPAEKALELARQLGDLALEGGALSILAHLRMYRYDHKASQADFEKAVDCFRQAEMPAAAAVNLNWLSLALARNSQHKEARETLQESIDLSRQIGDRRLEAENLRRMATNLMYANKHAEALPYGEQAADLHRQIGDRAGECHAYNVIALCHASLDRIDQAGEYFFRSLELAEQIDLFSGIHNALSNLLSTYYPGRMEFEAGLKMVETYLKHPISNNPIQRANLLDHKVNLLILLGQFETALEIAQQLLQLSEDNGTKMGRLGALSRMIFALAELGRYDEATQTAEQIIELSREMEERQGEAMALWGLGFITFHQDRRQDFERALQGVENGLDILRELGKLEGDDGMDFLMLKAVFQAELGDIQAAFETIAPGREYLIEHPTVAHPAIYLAIGRVLLLAGDREGAREVLTPIVERIQRAIKILEEPAHRDSIKKTWIFSGIQKMWEELNNNG
jgi:predicted ATPase